MSRGEGESKIILCYYAKATSFLQIPNSSEDAVKDPSWNGNAQTLKCLKREEELDQAHLGGYDRLFKTVNRPWFIVSGNENPSVLEMKSNNVDEVISVEALLSE